MIYGVTQRSSSSSSAKKGNHINHWEEEELTRCTGYTWSNFTIHSCKCSLFFLFTFFLHVEVAFAADGAGLPVLLRCLPDPPHQFIHLWSRALEATPCLEGREKKAAFMLETTENQMTIKITEKKKKIPQSTKLPNLHEASFHFSFIITHWKPKVKQRQDEARLFCNTGPTMNV